MNFYASSFKTHNTERKQTTDTTHY